MKPSPYLLLILSPLAPLLGSAQQATAPATVTPMQETVVVTGTAEPGMLAESPRAVVVLDTTQYPLAFETPEDYLRTDPSVFIQQRGGGGAQSDVTLRGASFEQTLVLVNGLRMNDAQASHHNLDLPSPLGAMRSIEVLHGAGSTLYGSDALGGVVNFLTATPAADSLTLRAGAGSFGENEQAAAASLVRKQFGEQLTGTRNFSTGFIPDRDYRNETASSETTFNRFGRTDVLLAGSDRAYGADQFYGPYNSWERTKGWFGSISQDLGEKTLAAFGYRRHADNFILLRDDPAVYANNHNDASWQAVLRRHDSPVRNATISYGLEFDGDSIDSNNLGVHARNRGAGYVNLALKRVGQTAHNWSLIAGLRDEILSGGARNVVSPDLAGSFWLTPSLKARASVGYGFRLPTYTDLYYSDPTTIGNAALKPESAWSADGGVDWYANAKTAASLTVFYSRQHDAIDYVRTDETQKWQAANLSGLRFTGVEGSLQLEPARNQSIRLGWTILSGAQKALHGLESEYVFNYPVNNASFEYTAVLKKELLVRTRVTVAQRYHADPYPVWDTELAREHGRIRPYLRLANLSNTGYQEIAGVPMPGRSITGGLQLTLSRQRPAPK